VQQIALGADKLKSPEWLEPFRGLYEWLRVRVMQHKEGLVQQEEENLSRKFKLELPPSDSYKSHWVVPPSKIASGL
jgi:hypothetical protein